MGAIAFPMHFAEMDLVRRLMCQAMRGSLGRLLVIRVNRFIEQILPMSLPCELSEAEMEADRAPLLPCRLSGGSPDRNRDDCGSPRRLDGLAGSLSERGLR
jgi:hypothetical protein